MTHFHDDLLNWTMDMHSFINVTTIVLMNVSVLLGTQSFWTQDSKFGVYT